jgi:serine/threonine protein kinase
MIWGENYSPVLRRRFFIEAEAVARLDHPNIIPIYEVGEFEDQPFFSMKMVSGGSLRKKMTLGEWGLPQDGASFDKSTVVDKLKKIVRLIATLARAVHHAHLQQVIHRDLKPGNILFDSNNTPYVADFGLAKILDADHSNVSQMTEVIGTLPYMAPEQVRAKPVTSATDIYSLGVILYELLAGQLPFHGNSPNDTLRLIENQPPLRLSHGNKYIPKDLETICLKCLEKDPGSRFLSAEVLAEDLERWLANQPIKARSAGPLLRIGRWAKRNPLGAAFIFILLLSLLAMSVAFFQQRKLQIYNDMLRSLLAADINQSILDLGNIPGKNSMVVHAFELAFINNWEHPNPNDIKLTFEVIIESEPTAQMAALSPLVQYLQQQMSRELHRKVFFNLRFCRSSQSSFQEILSKDPPDFQRLGAVAYLRARTQNPALTAVLQEGIGKLAVIFARTDSLITNLSQFADRTFAFGDINSTISVLAKYYLYREGGIYGTNQSYPGLHLKFYKCFDETPLPSGLTSNNVTSLVWVRPFSNAEALERVRTNEFDGAVIQQRFFDHFSRGGSELRKVKSFQITPNVYVAKADADPNIVKAFQNAMLSINKNQPGLIGKLPFPQPIGDFQMPDTKALDGLHSMLTNEVAAFDGVK